MYYKLNIYTLTVKTVNTEYDSQVLATFENIKHGTAISVSTNNISVYTDPVQEFTADLRLESVEDIHTEYNFVNIIAPSSATSNAIIQINYHTDLVKYTITFMNGETLLEERVVEYGKDVTYTGETPTKPNEGEYKFVFKGWADVDGNEYTTLLKVSGKTTYYASFEKTKANPALTLIIISSTSVAVVLTLVTMALIIKRQKRQSIADGDRIVELVDKLDEMSTKNSKSHDKDTKE